MCSTSRALESLWRSSGLDESSLSRVRLLGNPDHVVNSSFRLGVAAQVSVGLSGLSAAQLFALRTGKEVEQDVTVDARHAVLAFHSVAWYKIDNTAPAGEVWDNIAGIYRTKDNGYVRVHTNFPHHRRGILSILGISDSPDISKEQVAKAMILWNAIDFETEAAKRGTCATALRSFQEWDQHPHAQALTDVLPVTIRKVGEAPKRETKTKITRPLDQVRVLDLSRVLAGPIAGRTLAAHGADVLLVTSPNLPSLPLIDMETSLGKRTTQLDLTQESDRVTLIELARDCDVFLQAYRPGGLEAKGFGVDDLAKLRPGIVCANLNGWGWEGPWKDRKGFDSLVQTATGFNFEEGKAYHEYMSSSSAGSSFAPKPFPMQTLDYAAGYLLAFGVNVALTRTITEGGSWEVRVSLAAVGQWLRSLGRLSPEEGFGDERGKFPATRDDDEISKLSTTWPSLAGNGRSITTLRHPAVLSETGVREGDSGAAPMGLDVHSACWI